MGFTILASWYLYIESGPWYLFDTLASCLVCNVVPQVGKLEVWTKWSGHFADDICNISVNNRHVCIVIQPKYAKVLKDQIDNKSASVQVMACYLNPGWPSSLTWPRWITQQTPNCYSLHHINTHENENFTTWLISLNKNSVANLLLIWSSAAQPSKFKNAS